MKGNRRNAGFTLIEMLVVVAILVILAGTVLPKLDRVQLKQNKGVAANTAAGVSRYVQTYRIMHNVYPDRWDSLLDGSGNLWTASVTPSPLPQLDPQLTGSLPGGPTKLKTTTLVENATTHEVRSLARMGIVNLLDLDGASTDIPGNRFTQTRTLANAAKVAILNWDSVAGTGDDDAKALIDHIYPENKTSGGTSGAVPSGKKLVVFGFGPTNQAIGDVLQECPFYSNTDPTTYYHRYLAIFEVSSGGSRAELKAVVGADADRIDEEINDYFEK
jgi:prepilin-type N-terminal cleavage/methylation domain-containing protein